jgi:hypothetical protein
LGEERVPREISSTWDIDLFKRLGRCVVRGKDHSLGRIGHLYFSSNDTKEWLSRRCLRV